MPGQIRQIIGVIAAEANNIVDICLDNRNHVAAADVIGSARGGLYGKVPGVGGSVCGDDCGLVVGLTVANGAKLLVRDEILGERRKDDCEEWKDGFHGEDSIRQNAQLSIVFRWNRPSGTVAKRVFAHFGRKSAANKARSACESQSFYRSSPRQISASFFTEYAKKFFSKSHENAAT